MAATESFFGRNAQQWLYIPNLIGTPRLPPTTPAFDFSKASPILLVYSIILSLTFI